MRIIKFTIASLFLGFIFTSCDYNKDTEINYVQKNYLAGTWNFDQVGYMNNAGGLDYVAYFNDSSCDKDNVVFSENLGYQQNDFSPSGATCQTESVTGTYDLTNHTLTLTHTDTENVVHQDLYVVTKLTATELEVNYNDSETGKLTFLKLVRE